MTAVITPEIESALITVAELAGCELDKRGAVLIGHTPLDDPRDSPHIVARGWNGLPAGLDCTLRLCSPGNKVGGCKATAEHAEAMAIRYAAGRGLNVEGMDMVHGKVVAGKILVSRPPTEKACLECAKMMRAWGVAGIWLFVEGRHTEPLGAWTRWSVEEYYRHATGTF